MQGNDNGHILHKYIRTSKKIFHQTHKDLEKIGLYRGQPPLLFALWKQEGQSGRELSAALSIQPATVTKMVGRLKKNGFVITKQDTVDSRVSRVYLTSEGRQVKEQVQEIYRALKETVFQDFSEEELCMFEQFLDRMKANVQTTCNQKCGDCID